MNTEVENLLSRIPIRDSTFFDEFFRDFLGIFRKIDIFGNFGDFWKKGARGPPGVDFLGKVRVENREKWGKNEYLRNKLYILPAFLGLLPHFRVPPGVDSDFAFSKNV